MDSGDGSDAKLSSWSFSVLSGGELNSCRMYDANLEMLFLWASSRAKRFDAGPFCNPSVRFAEGVAIDTIPLMRSATTVWMSTLCSGDSKSMSRLIKFCEDSH